MTESDMRWLRESFTFQSSQAGTINTRVGKSTVPFGSGAKEAVWGWANLAPGLIFAEDDDVAPDVVWVRRDRLSTVLGEDGKLHSAPDLVIEVLSPGWSNEQRDRQAKLKLYSRRGVQEYWIVDWRRPQVEVYRREDAGLTLLKTLFRDDALESPLLPGFSCRVGDLVMP